MRNSRLEILLIEDNLPEADLIKDMLSEAPQPKFTVQHVQSLQEGLNQLQSRHFDLVLVDLALPDSQGLETAQTVRNQSNLTPVIVLTVLDDEDSALKLLQMDIQDYLIKGEINGRLLIHSIRYAIQRKRDSEQLRLSEARYRALFRDNPTMIITLDTDWTILSANPFCVRQLGYSVDELEGQSVLNVFHEDDRPALIEQLRKCLRNPDQVYRWQLRKVHKDGSLLWVEETAQAVHDLNGALSVMVVCQDITERKKAEAKIQWLASFPLMNPNPVLELDADGHMTFCNPAAKRILKNTGYDDTVNPLIPQDMPVILQSMRDKKAGQFSRQIESRGRFFEELIFIAPPFRSVRIYTMDITERKLAEEEIRRLNTDLAMRAEDLEALNRELEAFNYTVAHDLRKPLTVINLLCQTIEELCSGNLDEECKGYVQESYNSTLRMNQLIDALLNFSRLGRVDPRREKVDLSIIAQAAAAELKQAEPRRRVTFKIAEGVTLNGDIDLLRVVLDNLFGNAWKYSALKDEAIIEFGVTEIDCRTACFVRDNGVGFDMADADKLFIPFQCLPGAEECRGFGIGLATVDRIIRRHGGTVWAEGEPGKGATFYFTLEQR